MASKALVVAIVALAAFGWMGLATSGLVGASGTPPSGAPTPPGISIGAASGANAGLETGIASFGPLDSEPTAPAFHYGSLLSGLPSGVREAPWIRSLDGDALSLKPLVSLPNFNLLAHPATSVAAAITPGYVAQPAPLGLGDFGLGASTYSYNTSHLLGQVTFNTPPNATDPGSTGVIEPSAQGSHLGYVGSVYEFGIQLNTVATNITFPGSDAGFFWTQNVVDWNDTGIHFVDDTFNFTSGTPVIRPGTIYSGCYNNTAGVNQILFVYGGVFQCVGGTIPVSPASYPVTIQLYNNATINAQNRTQVSYGYWIDEAGTGTIYTGISDTVVFNNPTAPHTAPTRTPGFSIDGFAPTPLGLLRDAEIDIVGDIGGDNAVFRSVNGSVNLEYSNASVGGWQNVPSAYNFGADTGETSTGIADYWMPAHTLEINQGPAMLYGLWNARPSVSVAPGDIQLSGTVTPSYGFVFVSNTAPPADPFAAGAPADNLSWLPTNDLGQFNTYLPPPGAPWTPQYYVQAFASGSAEVNGTPVTGNTPSYVLTLPPELDNLDAPLYMFGNAQAATLAANLGGLGTPPYRFSDLRVNINASFNHLNDYAYPSFELVMAQGVTQGVVVCNITQGQDSPGGNFYILDGPAFGLLSPAPEITGSLPGYTSQINLFGGTGDLVSNETVGAVAAQGGAVVLWGETDPTVSDVVSETASQGVWVGDSVGTTVRGLTVVGANGIQDIGSLHTTGANITAIAGYGVEAFSSVDGAFSWINVTDGGVGVVAGVDYGPSVNYDTYYDLPGTIGLAVNELNITSGAVGASMAFSNGSVFTNVSASGAIVGIALDNTLDTSVNGLSASQTDIAVDVYNGDPTTLTHVTAFDGTVGVQITGATSHTVVTQSVFAENLGLGVGIFDGTDNFVYNNTFFANDGSPSVYNANQPQAYSIPGNWFNSSGGVGNYWSDWHVFSGDHLAPYPVATGVFDYYPLTSGPGTYFVTFTETGLPPIGKQWSVSLDSLHASTAGTAHTPTVTSVSFAVPNGTYGYVIVGPSGYRVTSPSNPEGLLSVNGANVSKSVTFSRGATYTITFHEAGLARGKTWCVGIGANECSTTASVVFKNLTPWTYSYVIGQPLYVSTTLVKVGSTWVVQSSGSTTALRSETIQVRFAQAVTFAESGLPAATSWSVSAGGLTGTSTNSTILLYLPNGTYGFTVHAVSGYRAIPSSGHVRVAGASVFTTIVFSVRPGHEPAMLTLGGGAGFRSGARAIEVDRVG